MPRPAAPAPITAAPTASGAMIPPPLAGIAGATVAGAIAGSGGATLGKAGATLGTPRLNGTILEAPGATVGGKKGLDGTTGDNAGAKGTGIRRYSQQAKQQRHHAELLQAMPPCPRLKGSYQRE